LSDAIELPSFRFEFQVTKAEDRLFKALAVNNLKKLIDPRITVVVPLLVYFLIFVYCWVAVDRGWLTTGAAFGWPFCFLAGYFLAYFVGLWAVHQLGNSQFELRDRARVTWHVDFDHVSIVVRTPGVESRMSWDSIDGVQDHESMVAIWYDEKFGFCIPARLFADPASRVAFANWGSEQVRLATSSRPSRST